MLSGIGGAWGVGPARAARALCEAIAGLEGPVIVVGEELGRAMARLGVAASVVATGARRAGRGAVAAPLDQLAELASDGAGRAAAVMAAGSAEPVLSAMLSACARAVREGGMVAVASAPGALVRKVVPAEALTSAFLHAALVGVEQRVLRGALITLGRVRKAVR